MSINIKVEFDDGDLRELFPRIDGMEQQFLDAIPGIARGIEREVQTSIERQLTDTPPEWHTKQQRFIWSHDPKKQAKARAYWFAYLKKTNQFDPKGGFYKRTGKLVKSWRAHASSSIRTNDATLTVEITNIYNQSSRIYGAQSTGWERVPSHEVTGWISGDGEEMQNVIDDTYTIMVEEIDRVVERLDPW